MGTIGMGLILWLLIVVGALFLVGVIGSPASADAGAADASLPKADVAGADFADLPRMAGAMRVEYKDYVQGEWSVTEVEYLADAQMSDVRSYYRQVFLDNGWNLLSVDTSGAEWLYGISSGMREGLVELEQVDGFVNIELQLHRSVAPSKVADGAIK